MLLALLKQQYMLGYGMNKNPAWQLLEHLLSDPSWCTICRSVLNTYCLHTHLLNIFPRHFALPPAPVSPLS